MSVRHRLIYHALVSWFQDIITSLSTFEGLPAGKPSFAITDEIIWERNETFPPTKGSKPDTEILFPLLWLAPCNEKQRIV